MPFYAKNSKIYFVYNGGSSIYSISANGGDLYEELTFSGKMIKYPAVNKDANKIVFVSNRDTSGNYELFTADLNEQGHIDENSLTKINLSISYDDALYPSYSPDGSKILLCCKNGGKGGIYVYDISSQTLTTLLSDGYNNEYPCYSTDGTKIFFVSDKDDDLGEVYEMDADGSNVRRISFNDKKERFLKFGE
jgi:TolB protein